MTRPPSASLATLLAVSRQLIIFLYCLKPSSAVLLAHFNTAPSVLSNNVL